MALSIGMGFTPYLNAVLQVLQQAAMVQAEKEDYDAIDYCNELRDGCLEAYTGIIQGLKTEENQFPGESARAGITVDSMVVTTAQMRYPLR